MPYQNFSPTAGEDGYVVTTETDCDGNPTPPTQYTDENTGAFIRCDGESAGPAPHYRRGYLFFNTSAIPGGATITKVELYLYCKANGNAIDVLLVKQNLQKSDYASTEDLYIFLAAGATYVTVLPVTGFDATYDLGSQAVTDLSGHTSWFGVGVISSNETDGGQIIFHSSRAVDEFNDPFNRPYLIVTYTVSGRVYTLTLLGVG